MEKHTKYEHFDKKHTMPLRRWSPEGEETNYEIML